MKTTRYRHIAAFLLIAAMLALNARRSQADQHYELLGIGPIHESLGGAGAAAPQDASWTLVNPATLVDLDKRLDLDLKIMVPKESMTPKGPPGIPVANRWAGAQTGAPVLPVPNFGMVLPYAAGTLGMGYFTWGGTRVDFDRARSTFGALQGHGDRRTDYYIAKLPLAYAVPLDNGWALGAALNLNWQRMRSDSLSLHLRPAAADYGWDDTAGLGLQLGIYKRGDPWSFGATYATRQWSLPFRRYRDLFEYDFDVPPAAQIGVAYRAGERLRLLLDYRWINYGDLDQFSAPPITGGLGWKDEHILKTGLIWDISDRWTLRAGFSHGLGRPQRDIIFVNAPIPGLANTNLSFGASYVLSTHADIHLVYSHAFKREMTEDGRGDMFSKLGKGTEFGLEEDTIGLGYTYRF